MASTPKHSRLMSDDEDNSFELDSQYPDFVNIEKINATPMTHLGLVKVLFQIIFNLSVVVENPRGDLMTKLKIAVEEAKNDAPNATRIGLKISSSSKDSKLSHDLHVSISKIDADVIQLLSNRIEQCHESSESADLFVEKLLFEVTLYTPVSYGM